MRAVILAGGMGTRLREETEYRPKPMVEIGGRPILWHIMKNLAQQGINDFVICLGYKGDHIRDFFVNYESRINDLTVRLGNSRASIIHGRSLEEKWNVTLVNTGRGTMTGGRLFKVRNYLQNEKFLCTYGDGLANVNLKNLLKFHNSHGKKSTVTAVRPTNRFATLKITQGNQVRTFSEKPKGENWISGGFFIFEPEVFDYLNENSILEREPLEHLAKDNQLMAYKHHGFWQPMDTYRESQELNSLWDSGSAPWKTW